MSYEAFEGAIIRSYADQVRKKEIDPTNYDLKSEEARRKYNRYISQIIGVNAREYKVGDFLSIGSKNVVMMSTEIIMRIFGPDTLPVIQEYFTKVISSKNESILDGVSLSILDTRTNKEEKFVEVPDINVSSTVVALVHEFVHFYFKKRKIDMQKKQYYEEIFSIYAEKIAAHTMQEWKIEKDFLKRVEETRLEGITWHYQTQAPTVIEVIAMYKRIKSNPRNINEIMTIQSLEAGIPTIKEPNGTTLVKQYYDNLADSYGIGYLYGESLFQRYLEDEKTMFLLLQGLIRKQKAIPEILDYYGIGANREKTYQEVERRIKEIKRGK